MKLKYNISIIVSTIILSLTVAFMSAGVKIIWQSAHDRIHQEMIHSKADVNYFFGQHYRELANQRNFVLDFLRQPPPMSQGMGPDDFQSNGEPDFDSDFLRRPPSMPEILGAADFRENIAHMAETLNFDIFFLYNEKGDKIFTINDRFNDVEFLKAALVDPALLAGNETASIWKDRNSDDIFTVLVTEVMAPDPDRVIAFIGKRISRNILNFISQMTKAKAAIEIEDQILGANTDQSLFRYAQNKLQEQSGKQVNLIDLTYQGEDFVATRWQIGYGINMILIRSINAELAFLDEYTRRLVGIAFFMLVAAIFVLFGMAHFFTRPIESLVLKVKAVTKGTFERVTETARKDEVGHLARSFNTMIDYLTDFRARLQDSYQRFNTLADNLPGFIFTLRMNHKNELQFEYVSSSCVDLLDGVTSGELRQNSRLFLDILAEEKRSEFMQSLQTAVNVNSPWIWEGAIEVSGNTKWMQGAATPKKIDEGVCIFEGLFIDTTEIMTVKAKKAEVENELRKAQEKLFQSEKLKLVGQLAAGVAHEVKNPLMILSASSEYLKRQLSQADDDAVETIADMQEAITRADSVVRGLLDLASVQDVSLSRVSLSEFLHGSVRLVRHETESRNIEMIEDLSDDLPAVAIDRGKMEQVITNLVLNASQSIGSGGKIVIGAKIKALNDDDILQIKEGIQTFVSGQEVIYITVEDNGPGISEEAMGKIFEPFFTTRTGKGGTGLGLAIIKNIVELHQGTIFLENRIEGGARAVLVLKYNDKI